MSLALTQIREMQRDGLAKIMRRESDKLSAGQAADFGQYKQMVGKIQGLREAMDEVEKVFNKLVEDDD